MSLCHDMGGHPEGMGPDEELVRSTFASRLEACPLTTLTLP